MAQQLAEVVQQRDDARRQLATLRAVLVTRGDGVWDDDKVAAEIERHVAAILADHRRIVGELRAELQAAHESLAVVAADAQATQTQLSAAKTTTAVLRKAVRELRSALQRVGCPTCSGTGMYFPACARCADSTDDHVCPDATPCTRPGCTQRLEALAGTAGLVEAPQHIGSVGGMQVFSSPSVPPGFVEVRRCPYPQLHAADCDCGGAGGAR